MQHLAIGSEKQLLIDDLFFEKVSGVRLRANPALKTHEKNMQRDRPWESVGLNWLNIMKENNKYRMWYECYDIDGWDSTDEEGSDSVSFCYAESSDGINWTKPNLGLFPYKGSSDTNILFRLIGSEGSRSRVHGVGLFKDPTAPSDFRYKGVSQGIFLPEGTPPHRIAGMYSKDGLHWTRYDGMISDTFADSQYSGFWDNRLKKYVIYGRVAGKGRSIGRMESDDFSSFEPLSLVLQPDDKDPPDSDYYNPAAMKYPFAENVYLMFPSLFQHKPQTLDIRLAVSRDGMHWTWPEQDVPFVPLGNAGELDGGVLYMGNGFFRVGDELWQYYQGSNLNHAEGELSELIKPGNGMTYSRVVSRLDGFVSADAGPQKGFFVTPALTYAGNILKLNVKVRMGGSVRVGLLDENENWVSDRTVEDCHPVTGDHVDKLVRWKTGGDVTACAGKPIKMRFEMQNVSLYSFRFTVGHDGVDMDH